MDHHLYKRHRHWVQRNINFKSVVPVFFLHAQQDTNPIGVAVVATWSAAGWKSSWMALNRTRQQKTWRCRSPLDIKSNNIQLDPVLVGVASTTLITKSEPCAWILKFENGNCPQKVQSDPAAFVWKLVFYPYGELVSWKLYVIWTTSETFERYP